MKNKDNYTTLVIKSSYKEFIYKIITAIFLRGLLLIIPVFWSDTINNLNKGDYSKTYSYVIVIVLLSCFFYIWQYLNQVSWFRFYDKLSLGYTALITKNNTTNIKEVSFGEYTNVINNDIDILCNFLGNGVARIIQILEIFFIYLYFLTQNIYIFIITVLISILMIILLIISSNQVKEENIKRKSTLDKKTVVSNQMYDSLKSGQYNDIIFKKFHKSSIDYLNANRKFNLLAQALIYLILGIIELTKYGVIIYSIYLIRRNMMEVGTIILIYTYYDKIITNFEVLGTISAEYQSFKVSLKRLNKLGTNQKELDINQNK
ncbi:MAG: ABC transporter ATP-binding protein [Bacilli bacterium]|nr:ABC transporter ATP-binding protein [Bacilli bacterium]